jgi:hypothetical protein
LREPLDGHEVGADATDRIVSDHEGAEVGRAQGAEVRPTGMSTKSRKRRRGGESGGWCGRGCKGRGWGRHRCTTLF